MSANGSSEPLVSGESEHGGGYGSVPPVVEEKRYKFRDIWHICLALWTATFCSALSSTIVANIQLEVSSEFNAGHLASWLGTAYLLGLAAATPLYGRLTTVIGQKGAMFLALSLFLIGTMYCALAPTMGAVMTARAIAGAGSGGMLTVAAIIISELVSLADRGMYQGGQNLLFGAGAAAGSVLGGLVADTLGWRMAFWIQVPPVVVAGLLLLHIELSASAKASDATTLEKVKAIDWLGCLTLMLSISLSTVSLSLFTTSGSSRPGPTPIALMATAFVSLVFFLIIESKVKQPILPLSLFGNFQLVLVLIGYMLTTATTFSRIYTQPVYLHVVRGLNGSETGWVLMPYSIAAAFASLYAGIYMRRFKEYKWFQSVSSTLPWIQAGSVILIWGMETNTNQLWSEMAVSAIGSGSTITTLLTSLIACVEAPQIPLAISAAYLFRAIGQVLGVSIVAAIQQPVLRSSLRDRLGDAQDELIKKIIQEPSLAIPTLGAKLAFQARLAYLDAIRADFGFILAGGVVLTVVCLLIKKRPL